MTRRKRPTLTPQERRLHYVENLVHGLGMTPVSWSVELADYTEVAPEEAFRVRCKCGKIYKHNQGLYIRRHHEKHHGLSWKEAWDGWCASTWREEQRRDLFARMDAMLESSP